MHDSTGELRCCGMRGCRLCTCGCLCYEAGLLSDGDACRHDHRIASMARGRVKVQAMVDAHNERGLEMADHCGKKHLAPINSGLGGINGHSTYQSLNPSRESGSTHYDSGEDFYPSRGGRALQYYTYPTKNGMLNLHGHLFN